MKSPEIRKSYEQYIESHPNRYKPGPDDRVAILFGDDQFKIDYGRWRIRLPELGWMDLHEQPPKRPDWVAVLRTNENTLIHMNKGGHPFSEESKSFLPVKNNTILAMPYIDFQKIQDKMVGY